ncbi:iron donor protein CyaY [Inhella gelatinilytica]|uniref:Iron-sulfur cluster assembly protein CyaY n=1 Tax=Inhella gelatinilytica TaxID=2795030 RepID=A0A931NDN6_9BURK|nr:iron donor protein CyaY [Inhella gelatinilytica]MBH9552425.1 iron donor protein CyaY [Inhella gelatinilytica]
MQDADYHQRAETLLRRLEAQADAWLQEDDLDVDASRNGGVLELTLPNRTKLVVNKQPPLSEVWLAAQAGGFHFRWRDDQWRDTKSGERFEQVFLEHMSRQAGRALQFTVA